MDDYYLLSVWSSYSPLRANVFGTWGTQRKGFSIISSFIFVNLRACYFIVLTSLEILALIIIAVTRHSLLVYTVY